MNVDKLKKLQYERNQIRAEIKNLQDTLFARNIETVKIIIEQGMFDCLTINESRLNLHLRRS
jgi:hypothetical protein